jgi:hypothetical protein
MMPRPMNAIMTPINPPTRAINRLPEVTATPMKTAPISVIILAKNRPYILSMSRTCDIERSYHGLIYLSFGFPMSFSVEKEYFGLHHQNL